MNFDDALRAHAMWKLRIRAFLADPDDSLDPDRVACASDCELGRWIDGDGQRYIDLPEFKCLCDRHLHFHKVAGEIVRKAKNGEIVKEQDLLSNGSVYDTASGGIFSALLDLKAKIGAARG